MGYVKICLFENRFYCLKYVGTRCGAGNAGHRASAVRAADGAGGAGVQDAQ